MVLHCGIRVWSESNPLENILYLVLVVKLVTFRSYCEILTSSCKPKMVCFILHASLYIYSQWDGWCSALEISCL